MIDDCDYYNKDSFQYNIFFCDRVSFLIFYYNVRSIVNKYDDFINFLVILRYEFSVIGLIEIWLIKNNMDELLI